MSFVEYINNTPNKVKIKIKNKNSSILMKLINFFLRITNVLKITHIKDFMTKYVTTIGYTIYGGPNWSNNMMFNLTLLHEIVHVMEHHHRGLKYSLGYIFSPNARCFYESICYQAEAEIEPRRRSISYVDSRVDALMKYGIRKDVAQRELRKRIEEIEAGQLRPESGCVVAWYRRWNNAE
jgi:hypothetical protein